MTARTHIVQVRHPYVNEVPSELIAGFEALPIDPEWQWVLVADGRVVAQMLCARMHGLLAILRLTAFPDAPRGWAVKIFRGVMADVRTQGIIGYMTFLSDSNPQERKLMRIVQKSGGMLLPASGAWAFGSTEVRY
jgi:hypothetical protein